MADQYVPKIPLIVERVARVLCEQSILLHFPTATADAIEFHFDVARDKWHAKARAVITTMLSAMIDVSLGGQAMPDAPEPPYPPGDTISVGAGEASASVSVAPDAIPISIPASRPSSKTATLGPSVVQGKLFYRMLDGSTVTCNCIGEPYASRIVAACDARATQRETPIPPASNLVNRVARIVDPSAFAPNVLDPFHVRSWTLSDDQIVALQEMARQKAREIIAAMREPTEEMCREGYTAACRHDYGDTVPSSEIAPETWRAMIDAAMKE